MFNNLGLCTEVTTEVGLVEVVCDFEFYPTEFPVNIFLIDSTGSKFETPSVIFF